MTWASLFERADAITPAVSVADVRDELEDYRSAVDAGEERRVVTESRANSAEGFVESSGDDTIGGSGDSSGDDSEEGVGDASDPSEAETDESTRGDAEESDLPAPARVVADADVLAADLLVGGDARAAMDHVRAHRWVDLVASDELLADGFAVVASLADDELARDWRDQLAARRIRVTHPPGDHPGLASAYAGRAAHLLTFDEGLSSSGANLALRDHLRVSVRTPHAFATMFDPERLYPAVVGGEYPGPDADPRA